MRLLLLSLLLTLSACQLFPKRQEQPADIKDAGMDKRINPDNLDESVVETVPLMNNGVKSLYNRAQHYYQSNAFPQAIATLERAYTLQPQAAEISQLLAEIYLHKGDNKQAHYWASIATKNAPAKGKICEKSWRLLALASEQLNDGTNHAKAMEQQENCLVKPANRF